jgi:undecaprenyl-diphosphatase
MNTLQAISIQLLKGLLNFYPSLIDRSWVLQQRCWECKKVIFKNVSGFDSVWCHLAIVVLYWKKFFDFKNFTFYLKWLLPLYLLWY